MTSALFLSPERETARTKELPFRKGALKCGGELEDGNTGIPSMMVERWKLVCN